MTTIQWFFKLFPGYCRIQTITGGIEVFADNRVFHYQGDDPDKAMLEFLGNYLKNLKGTDAQSQNPDDIDACRLCGATREEIMNEVLKKDMPEYTNKKLEIGCEEQKK